MVPMSSCGGSVAQGAVDCYIAVTTLMMGLAGPGLLGGPGRAFLPFSASSPPGFQRVLGRFLARRGAV